MYDAHHNLVPSASYRCYLLRTCEASADVAYFSSSSVVHLESLSVLSFGAGSYTHSCVKSVLVSFFVLFFSSVIASFLRTRTFFRGKSFFFHHFGQTCHFYNLSFFFFT